MASLLSKATIATVGLTCKAFLNIGYCSSVTVNGLERLVDALDDEKERLGGRGVVTVANHISTLDDPLAWGILPARIYVHPRKMRWSLGAADICFTNPVFSAFFRNGQVLETFRGNGIFQPAVDSAIERLNTGGWVHLFGEGKVNQPTNDPEGRDPVSLLRFKWGVGRILMEVAKPPLIIPMWLTGFEKLMPEGRSGLAKFLPRPGVALSVTFGEPIDDDAIRNALRTTVLPESIAAPGGLEQERASVRKAEEGWLGDAVSSRKGGEGAAELAAVRSAVTALVQREVEKLGREVVRTT